MSRITEKVHRLIHDDVYKKEALDFLMEVRPFINQRPDLWETAGLSLLSFRNRLNYLHRSIHGKPFYEESSSCECCGTIKEVTSV